MTAEIGLSGGDLTVTPDAGGQIAASAAPDSDAGLLDALHSLRERGRFEEAAALVHAADADTPAATMTAAAHTAAGQALTAVSDYSAAGVHLLLSSTDPLLAPAALGRLAELAWIEHDYVRGRADALAGLALDPSNRVCRIQLRRCENDRSHRPGLEELRGRLSHAAFFADPEGNAGDRVLTDDVRRCFTAAGRTGVQDAQWHDVHVHQLFDERRLAEVNATDGLVVGGGGLFLPDTSPNGNSGWQWNIADDVLAQIDVPLVVFAVGYNMFEGQTFGSGDARNSRFARSLRALVERSTFVGLRNHGSVERVRELLPGHLADRIGWQPCPTTITDLLAERVGGAAPAPMTAPAQSGDVLLNCAYDRAGQRFGSEYGTFLAALRDWVIDTRERAVVRYAAHCVDDERLVGDLRREYGLTLPVIAMYNLTPDEIHRHYRQAQLVVGMRGHASMIPFGCGTPIISLISHPKLRYFLEDIDRPHWGVPVRDPQLAGRLSELTTTLLDSGPAVKADIARLQRRLADVTFQNLRSLPGSFSASRRVGQDETGE